MFGLIVIVLGVASVLGYLGVIAKSRRSTDHLYDVPDDMKRADDNQQPPFDGSSGWV